MKRIDFHSYSNHLEQKVIPSINKSKIYYKFIFTQKKKINNKKLILINKKNKFIDKIKNSIVYISSINSDHYYSAKNYLNNKIPVICEKPLTTNLKNTKDLIKISFLNKTPIVENLYFINHSSYRIIEKVLKNKDLGNIKKVFSNFTIPLNDKKNFRFISSKGGGALNDLGYYFCALNVYLFNNKPNLKYCEQYIDKKTKIDIGGKSIYKYKNCSFIYKWGFRSLYKNNISISAEKGWIKMDYFYSKPENVNIVLKIKKKNKIITYNFYGEDQIKKSFLKYLNLKKRKINSANNNRIIEIAKQIHEIKINSKKIKK